MKTAVIVTTYCRPDKLARSLVTIVAAAHEVDAPILVVNDGGDFAQVGSAIGQSHQVATATMEAAMPRDEEGESTFHGFRVPEFMNLPSNRGLAGALNIGLSYWLADPSIEAIHYFQDDVEVDPLAIAACNAAMEDFNPEDRRFVITGHDAKEHRERGDEWAIPAGRPNRKIQLRRRPSCRATHMAATRESWLRVLPIPSRALGLPSRKIRDANRPEQRGTGSGVDWWIVRDSPNHLPVLCIPGLVRTFAWKKEDSTWDNQSIAGEDGPLHRDAIKEWVEARGK